MKGVYSIAEVVDDSNKRANKTIFCILTWDIDDNGYEIVFDDAELKSLKQVAKMVNDNGGICFLNNLDKVAEYLNS